MIDVFFFHMDSNKTCRRKFSSPATLQEIGEVGDKLGYHLFNAYEGHALLGGWGKFKGGWSFCGK